jgi:hypothetical protein
MDARAFLDHQFTVAAYALTWAIQLGYLAWLGLRWRALKRNRSRRITKALPSNEFFINQKPL